MTARHRLLPVFATAIIASLTLSASTAHAAECTGAAILPSLVSIPAAKAATLCLLNQERTSRGLLPLTEQPVLATAAQTYSNAMVSHHFFDHVSPAGETIEDRLASYIGSVGTWSTGENLAWGAGALSSPDATVKSWMASAGHRDNILNPDFSEVGIGMTAGSPQLLPAPAATYVTEFGGHGAAADADSVELRASASASAPRPVSTRRVSAKTKKQISKRCHSVARRTKSKSARAARYDRCVSKALRAAAR